MPHTYAGMLVVQDCNLVMYTSSYLTQGPNQNAIFSPQALGARAMAICARCKSAVRTGAVFQLWTATMLSCTCRRRWRSRLLWTHFTLDRAWGREQGFTQQTGTTF